MRSLESDERRQGGLYVELKGVESVRERWLRRKLEGEEKAAWGRVEEREAGW